MRLIDIFICLYILVSIPTFGYSSAHAESEKAGRGVVSAVFWPAYWSWWFFEDPTRVVDGSLLSRKELIEQNQKLMGQLEWSNSKREIYKAKMIELMGKQVEK